MSGFSVTSIKLPEDLEQYKTTIIRLREKHQDYLKEISCLTYQLPMLALMSSRHFRTPVIPIYWQSEIQVRQSSDLTDSDSE